MLDITLKLYGTRISRIAPINTDQKGFLKIREYLFYPPDPCSIPLNERKMPMLHKELTGKILQAFYTVYNTLGYGFLEKVYENALRLELQQMGLHTITQQKIVVHYRGKPVGDYFADMVVNDTVVIELKAAEALREEHRAQLLNYLKATNKEIGLLLNFGKKPAFKRIIYTNDRKRYNTDRHG